MMNSDALKHWCLGPALVPVLALTLVGAEKGRRRAPVIFVGGVVNAASFRPAPDNFISPNSIISIFGDDFSFTTREVRKGDLDRGRLPTTLAGVSVLIGGIPAPLYFVSPTQINAQVPTPLAPGETSLRVLRENLQSPAESVKIRHVAPGLFMFQERLIVVHQDFTLVGRGVPEGATPARPGQLVILWATGLGPTSPTVRDGELPVFAARVTLPVRIWLGERELFRSDVLYVGQAPEFAGLYQINIVLPKDTPAGDLEVVLEVDGVEAQRGGLIAVDP